MERLIAAVAPGATGRLYVLHGLGGCGKTAIAYALFHHATAEVGRTSFWVNASETASLRAGMLAVASDMGAGEGELMAARNGLRAAADLVWAYLDDSERPWLLVLDNADNPAILRDGGWLRSNRSGTVIVTTRQAAAHWWPDAELIRVGPLPRVHAAQVLCDLAPHSGSVEEAAEVAEKLGRLPLALTLAGGFLADQVVQPWSMTEYARNLEAASGGDAIELIDQGAGALGGDSRHLLSQTWQLSLAALVDQGVPEAVDLLRILSCWTGDPLPLSVFSGVQVGPELPSQRVERGLRGLLDQSLTELVPGPVRCLRTHSVLLESVANGTPQDQRERIASTATDLLSALLPEIPDHGVHDAHVSRLAPHALGLLRRVIDWDISGEPTVNAAVVCVNRLVVALHRTGDYAPALDLAREAISHAGRCLAEDNFLILQLEERIGRALYRLGRFHDSEAVHRRVLANRERIHGPAAPETLESCLGLSRPLAALDQRSEAYALAARAVTELTGEFGPVDPRTLIARSYLLEWAPGAPQSSVRDDVAAGMALIADCRREMGAAHTITMRAELTYAFALCMIGRTADSLPVAREAYQAHKERFGADLPATLAAQHRLADTLAKAGDRQEAMKHAEALVAGRIRALGRTHPFTREAEALLASCRTEI